MENSPLVKPQTKAVAHYHNLMCIYGLEMSCKIMQEKLSVHITLSLSDSLRVQNIDLIIVNLFLIIKYKIDI